MVLELFLSLGWCENCQLNPVSLWPSLASLIYTYISTRWCCEHLCVFFPELFPLFCVKAMARVWRDGQKKTVHIYRLLTAGQKTHMHTISQTAEHIMIQTPALCLGVCYFLSGTIEERIFQRQVAKQGLSGTVVDLGKKAEHTSFSTSELRDLFSLTDTLCLTHDLLNCSCSMDGSAHGRHSGDEKDSYPPK